uniref:Protein sieve element occlusion B-like n=1 Tax=Tanacetum cinerariifolium TaxID=118510 RepID=A0A699GUI1_TANCI|nr:protein sieve element occlusion B-like [Tanacetum cinerariifolium]
MRDVDEDFDEKNDEIDYKKQMISEKGWSLLNNFLRKGVWQYVKLLESNDMVQRLHVVVAKDGRGQFKIIISALAAYPKAANATNSDSIVDPVMHVCFLEAHEMTPPPSRNTHPLVEDESST